MYCVNLRNNLFENAKYIGALIKFIVRSRTDTKKMPTLLINYLAIYIFLGGTEVRSIHHTKKMPLQQVTV